MTALGKKLAIGLIRAYQVVSRLLPPCCRFVPSCSEYTAQAIERYGLLRGIYLAAAASCAATRSTRVGMTLYSSKVHSAKHWGRGNDSAPVGVLKARIATLGHGACPEI